MLPHKLSGAQRRKLIKDKNAKESAVLKKIPRLENFFQSRETSAARDPENEDPNSKSVGENPCTSDILPIDDGPKIVEEAVVATDIELRHGLDFSDPAQWPELNQNMIDEIIRHPIKQDVNSLNFDSSKRVYLKQARYATKKIFFHKMTNGGVRKREWLCYSETAGTVFCVPCKLFNRRENNVFTTGFNDWKNDVRITEHERGSDHRTNITTLVLRSNVLGKIDSGLHTQYLEQRDYWREVLHRVVDVIKFLGTRGLAFRGTAELFGSPQNGNYLGALELIAEYDPFLKGHIEKLGNPGKGNVSYLSSGICNEFVELIYTNLVGEIISALKLNKYYSISVDSTPDISHTDQLTFILRYVQENGVPTERFMRFIHNTGHSAAQMESAVLNTLSELQIDIQDCRGQSYDNASNMSGRYGGLQAKIKAHNPQAIFVPCAAHSLNLVGQSAADCCSTATQYFMFVQQVYTFLSASTGRWARVKEKVADKGDMLLPRYLSATRWSARADACLALLTSYEVLCEAIEDIADDASEKPCNRAEAKGLCRQFDMLETGIMTAFWNAILQRFDKTNKSLQSQRLDIFTTMKLYESLKTYIEGLRDDFSVYEEKGKELSQCTEYRRATARRRRRTVQHDETNDNDVTFDGRENMKINTFFVIYNLVAELTRRSNAYSEISSRFSFIDTMLLVSDDEVIMRSRKLCHFYPNDLADDFSEEFMHFREFIRAMNLPAPAAAAFLAILREKEIVATFPSVDIALRIYLSILSSNASGERSFSVLKRVKNYLRNSISNHRLSSIAFLAANHDLVCDMDCERLIDKFVDVKVRKRAT